MRIPRVMSHEYLNEQNIQIIEENKVKEENTQTQTQTQTQEFSVT